MAQIRSLFLGTSEPSCLRLAQIDPAWWLVSSPDQGLRGDLLLSSDLLLSLIKLPESRYPLDSLPLPFPASAFAVRGFLKCSQMKTHGPHSHGAYSPAEELEISKCSEYWADIHQGNKIRTFKAWFKLLKRELTQAKESGKLTTNPRSRRSFNRARSELPIAQMEQTKRLLPKVEDDERHLAEKEGRVPVKHLQPMPAHNLTCSCRQCFVGQGLYSILTANNLLYDICQNRQCFLFGSAYADKWLYWNSLWNKGKERLRSWMSWMWEWSWADFVWFLRLLEIFLQYALHFPPSSYQKSGSF